MQAPKFLTTIVGRFRVLRFALVGVSNTAVDFILLNTFIMLISNGTPSSKVILICNTASATVAAVMSFFLNKHFVFKSKQTSNYFMGRFLMITLTGLYLIQNFIVVGSRSLLEGYAVHLAVFLSNHFGLHLTGHFIALNVAKLLGTAVSLIWNYSLYKVFVFRPPSKTLIKDGL